MKNSRWSPADLERQRLVVRRIALRSEQDLRTFAAARARLVAAVHRQIGVPLALASCFVAGMVAAARISPQREAAAALRAAGRLRHITALLRTIALAATAYKALFQGNLGSSSPARYQETDSLPPVAQG